MENTEARQEAARTAQTETAFEYLAKQIPERTEGAQALKQGTSGLFQGQGMAGKSMWLQRSKEGDSDRHEIR